MFQVQAPLLDAIVLGLLVKEDSYGYMLTQNIQNIVEVSESTLYPVLRRLQKNELVDTYDLPFNGRNRRYYKITNHGIKELTNYKIEWINYKKNIDKVLEVHLLVDKEITHD